MLRRKVFQPLYPVSRACTTVSGPGAPTEFAHQQSTAENHEVEASAFRALSSHIKPTMGKEGNTDSGSKAGLKRPTSRSNVEYEDATNNRMITRMYEDLVRETDALGGKAHSDYFRDPVIGYAPQYAPRNFAEGGKVDTSHHSTPLAAESSMARRRDQDHTTRKYQQRLADTREATRRMTQNEYKEYIASVGDSMIAMRKEHDAMAGKISKLPTPKETFSRMGVPVGDSTFVPDQYRVAQIEKRRGDSSGNRQQVPQQNYNYSAAGTDFPTAAENRQQKQEERLYDWKSELMREVHGLRLQERHEYQVNQRSMRRPNHGYDFDRGTSAKAQGLFGQIQFDPLVPPGSYSEAQKAVREHSVTSDDQLLAKEMHRNSVKDTPMLGESLTDSMLSAYRLNKKQEAAQLKTTRDEALGVGRQGPLVREAGPDHRTQSLHKNDQRILDAAMFGFLAYSKNHGARMDLRSPHDRNNTNCGMGHLLRNKFDLDRREELKANGKIDPVEKSTIHYGIPVSQQLDTFVRTRRNSRAERPTDYFTPFPSMSDLRIQQVYRDVEGFPLLRMRPEFLEWELLVRWRSHHQQRRQVALLHRLEPRRNETAHERDERRRKLDELCEKTPFDATQIEVRNSELKVEAESLRKHFGVYLLPTPDVVSEVVNGDDSGAPLQIYQRVSKLKDTREHLMSMRYMNNILTNEAFIQRIRSPVKEISGKTPDLKADYSLPQSVIADFSEKEKEMYNRYISIKMKQHDSEVKRSKQCRRWIVESNMYGQLSGADITPVEVIDIVSCEDGSVITVSFQDYQKRIRESVSKALSAGGCTSVGDVDLNTAGATVDCCITLDAGSGDGGGVEHRVDFSSQRKMRPVSVQLDDGSNIVIDEKNFFSRPLETEWSGRDPNESLNFGMSAAYHYNRNNYIETQDAIWEERTYIGEEGWTLAQHTDGLKVGLSVLAQKPIVSEDDPHHKYRVAKGEYQSAQIVEYNKQPFFNPNPRVITVKFQSDDSVEQVPLENTMIWQVTWGGPERAAHDETRKSNNTMRRFVDAADPKGQKRHNPPHFLDQYRAATTEDPYRSVKQITDLDNWTIDDESRTDNKRPISITHRTDYVTKHYLPQYTPWEWIISQEADAPHIKELIRTEDTTHSYNFSPNRFWRWKRRPTGYIHNHPNEVRDLIQYIDHITPWRKAQKIRNLWEVRAHHPMPRYHRPEISPHRNTVGLLPSHTWDLEKKTGKVKSLKDSVRDYQVLHQYPSWVQL